MRKKSLFSPVLILFSVFAFLFATSVRADDDPPGRVARLNYIQGSISFQPSGESDWVQANPNRPLTVGDNLWADRDARGELHIGSSSIRIGSETGITFLNLDDRTVQIQLAQGSLNVNVRRLDGGDDFEIDTPNLAFTLERPGNYRVDVDPNGNSTVITVRSGEGEATGGGSEFHMDSNDRATFSGTDSLNFDGGEARGFDDFDAWCNARDDREEHSQSARYVSRDIPGYDDLDDNGDWRNVPDYGYAWFPTRVAYGWAPYRNGHWAWVAPWGWTWVEDEPWGFAPFHYGRWAEYGDRWCWVPGPMVVRPVYAPALVVFVGGPRFGMSVSFGGGGGVGWFPLGPREVYVPPYRTSERYMQRVNVTNTTVNVVNVTNIYNNTTVNKVTYMHQNNIGAVTAVSHDTFVNARPVAASNVRVNQQQMQAAEVQRNFTVAPVQRSVIGASAPAASRPPAAMMSRQVVVKETPAPVRPSFNNSAPQPNRTFRQASAPPIQQQQQQQRQQPGQQQRPGQFPQQPAQQQPQNRQQMTTQPQQQPQMQQRQLTEPPVQQQQEQRQQPGQQQRPGQFPQQPAQQQPQNKQQMTTQPQQQPQMQQKQQAPTPPAQQQAPPQFPSRQNQPQPGQQQQMQQRQQTPPPPQQQAPPPQQQQRQQLNQNNNPPADQRPPVKFAPPARTNEDTYHPHQFDRPPNAAPPAAAAPPSPPPAQREQPKPQERAPDPKKQPDPKDPKDRK
jgi:hypothetical protein